VDRSLSSAALADPTLAAGYRLRLTCALSLATELGTRVALDDSPGDNTFPTRLPPSTGQSRYFASLAPTLTLPRLQAQLGYRLAYHPGSAASYLVRVVGNQSYASGAIEPFLDHRLWARVELSLLQGASAYLSPFWQITEQPRLTQRGPPLALSTLSHREELGLALGLSLSLTDASRLELAYTHLFLQAWRRDPFFPIAIPEQGLTVRYRVWGQ
jgi:hypothetical protein